VDDCGLSSAMINRLRSIGHEVVTVTAGCDFQQVEPFSFAIEPSNPQHYDWLIHGLQEKRILPDHIVVAWSVTAEHRACASEDDFTRAQAVGFYSVVFLAKALSTRNVRHEINLFVISNSAQDVTGTEILHPEKSTLQGPCTVIRQEYPNIRTKSIDVEVSANTDSTADLLLGEFLNADSNLFVAYRNGQRWVQTYESLSFAEYVLGRSSFKKGGVYLITGGHGDVGITISEYLAKNYQAKLVLVGRSALPDRKVWKALSDTYDANDPVHERIRRLERIEQLGGEVVYMTANVADANGMMPVLDQAYDSFGALHGVIHAAGIVGDYLEIKDATVANCDRHFQAKAHGLIVLEKVLEGRQLDFCLLLSSLASVLGGLGQVTYASANIYMDMFARRHNRSSSVPWLSVNWDVWRTADRSVNQPGMGTTLKELGMSAAEATKVMDCVLMMRGASHLVVSTGDLDARINQWIKLESLNNSQRLAGESRSQSTLVQGDKTEQRIARIWQEALGIDEIGLHDSFAQLWGDSLLAIRIVAEMRK